MSQDNFKVKPIDIASVDQQTVNNKKPKKELEKRSFIATVSHIQEMSAIEAKTQDEIDSQLFTLAKVASFTITSLIMALISTLFLFLFFLSLLCINVMIKFIEIPLILEYTINYIFALFVVVLMFYFALLARYETGNYTRKAILILFLSKAIFCFLFGSLIIYFLMPYIFIYFIKEPQNLIDFIKFFVTYLNLSQSKAFEIYNTVLSLDTLNIKFKMYALFYINIFFPLIYLLLNRTLLKKTTVNDYERY